MPQKKNKDPYSSKQIQKNGEYSILTHEEFENNYSDEVKKACKTDTG